MQLQDALSRYPSALEGKTSVTFLDSYVSIQNVRSKNPKQVSPFLKFSSTEHARH